MHKAIVAQVTAVEEIPGADRIHVAVVLGEKCVVGKDVGVGYVGCLFPEGLQLSEEYCYENNLHRNVELNKDKDKTGFFEASRRIRAQPFLKVKSTALFMPMTSLDYLGLAVLSVGDQFDSIDGHKICQKYFSEQTRAAKVSGQAKQAKKNFAPFFEKHVNSEQFKHNGHTIPVGALLSFHAKWHGSSARYSHTLIERELPSWKLTANYWLSRAKLPILFKTKKEWGYVAGTRNVVLKEANKEGFHGSEQFRLDILETLKPHLTRGLTIYGEIVGFVNGKSIMPKHNTEALKDKAFTKKYGKEVTYRYGCSPWEFKFMVYRITSMGQDMVHRDWSVGQVQKWCNERNILCTVEVSPPVVYDGDIEKLAALVEELTERPGVLTEDFTDPTHISEGIIIRVDKGDDTPTMMKNKSFAFKVMEGICKDVDPEDAS